VDRPPEISGSGSPLIGAMRRTGFYPERAERIEFKQTHMSYVFLAGEYVYKVKKPVHFDFADCSTLATRYELCCEEVRLNRRLAPEIYLGVLPIYRAHDRFYLGEETRGFDPAAHEYAIKMRRLPEDRMLDQLVFASVFP
jgi:aminoglycoside phosphotransferase family enzyme